jgi:hypothetical protein
MSCLKYDPRKITVLLTQIPNPLAEVVIMEHPVNAADCIPPDLSVPEEVMKMGMSLNNSIIFGIWGLRLTLVKSY